MHNKTFSWEVRHSPYPSQFLAETQKFGEMAPLYLIDQYGGRRPALLNAEFLSNGKIEFHTYPSALLDSNILDAIDKKVAGGKSLDGLDGFLRFVTERNWDFSPIFYYLEHYAKASEKDFLPNAIRRTESLLKLHSMDEKKFLETGSIVPDSGAIAYYTEKAGVKSISEVAEKWVKSFIQPYDRRALAEMIEATQIALIKMVLIHKCEHPKSTAAKKYVEFVRFLRKDLGIVLAREAHLALHYFCDRAGRLLGIQSNTAIEKALSTVRSTAWDIFLLRLPEMLFTESPDELCISYVATQERQLYELARLFTIEKIRSSEARGFTPHVSYDPSGIPESVIAEIPSDIDVQQSPISLTSPKYLSVPTGLLAALERELERFCNVD